MSFKERYKEILGVGIIMTIFGLLKNYQRGYLNSFQSFKDSFCCLDFLFPLVLGLMLISFSIYVLFDVKKNK